MDPFRFESCFNESLVCSAKKGTISITHLINLPEEISTSYPHIPSAFTFSIAFVKNANAIEIPHCFINGIQLDSRSFVTEIRRHYIDGERFGHTLWTSCLQSSVPMRPQSCPIL